MNLLHNNNNNATATPVPRSGRDWVCCCNNANATKVNKNATILHGLHPLIVQFFAPHFDHQTFQLKVEEHNVRFLDAPLHLGNMKG